MEHIRNFCIIAHIDHGKSTLADRFLEVTKTVEDRKMKEQYLDQLELERERGITIKMAPVRMRYGSGESDYELNLIDTPGHSDFSYEVSRALLAVEGAVLLVDAGQGIQAQTLANFMLAKEAGLEVVGAVNKVDLVQSGSISEDALEGAVMELAELLGCDPEEIHRVSGKTGEGVEELLDDIVRKVRPPESLSEDSSVARALIFDSFYDNHKGVVASVRVFAGSFSSEGEVFFAASGSGTRVKELGCFSPTLFSMKKLEAGEIGYIATGVKDPGKIKIGDTVVAFAGHKGDPSEFMLPGYTEPRPAIFASFYPEDGGEYDALRQNLEKLRLNDSSLSIEPDQNEVLGRGFKVGCLGRLHFEIVAERLKREFETGVINTFPSVRYRVRTKAGWEEVIRPEDMPADALEVWEPMIALRIIFPSEYISEVLALQKIFRMKDLGTETRGDRIEVTASMPLAELVSDFDDVLKSSTEGYASFSYEFTDYEPADVVGVDFLVAGEPLPGLSRFFPRETLDREARRMVERLKDLLPRQQYAQAVQARGGGRIIARADIPALRKDVTGYLYGGDRTRKMKLWKKQAKGKKRLRERADASISPEVFKELLKRE